MDKVRKIRVFTPEFKAIWRKETPDLMREMMFGILWLVVYFLTGTIFGMAMMASILK
jgi:hypothetical protein